MTVTDVKYVTTVTTVTFETATKGVTGVYETVTLRRADHDPVRFSKIRARHATRLGETQPVVADAGAGRGRTKR